MKFCSLDYEYNETKEPQLNLVCGVLRYAGEVHKYWLHNDESSKARMVDHINKLHEEGYVFLAYSVTAEARCFLALGLDPLQYRFIDEYIEYRQLLNHNHKLMYGVQYKDGKVKTTKPPKPKWEQTEDSLMKESFDKPLYGLGAACFKLLGIKIDTAFKTKMRDLIISAPDEFTKEEQEEIMEYCEEDTAHLYPMFFKMIEEYKKLLGTAYDQKQLSKDMKIRAEFACHTAIIEDRGYPIDIDKTQNFTAQVDKILFSCQQDIIAQFPDNSPFYKFKRKEGLFTLNKKAVQEEINKWVKTQKKTRWLLTDKKELSLSLGAFTAHFNYTHNYPRGHYFAQIIRYLKLKQNLNGFTGKKNNFWDYVGSDGRVRPYLGIYTAQSSRSQPKATGFIPLKSAWFRSLISPKKGRCIISIDWASQEYIIAALLSGDKNMIKAYETGDIYIAFLVDCKAVPPNATKKTHKKERVMAKPIILGQQYDLTEIGLAKQLTETTGIKHTPEMALKWITKHKKSYSTMWTWKSKIQRYYKLKKNLRLPDGWHLWGDNSNFRSVGNVPVQGMAACMMRKATSLAHESGLEVLYQLHDAVYCECDIEDGKKHLKLLAEAMDQAFRFYFQGAVKEKAFCRLDADMWGPGIKPSEKLVKYSTINGEKEMPVKLQEVYIDERSEEQYEYFKRYFEKEYTDFKSMQF